VVEEDCGSDIANGMNPEPYFVNFLRDAPEATGYTKQSYAAVTALSIISDLILLIDSEKKFTAFVDYNIVI